MNKTAMMMAFVLAVLPLPAMSNGVIIGSDGRVSTVIIPPQHSSSGQPASEEEIMFYRIAILEQAKNSQDPDVLMMAEQVRANIAKEQELERLKQENWLKWLFVAEKKALFLTLCLIILLIPIGLLFWSAVSDWIEEVKSKKAKQQEQSYP